MTCTQKRISGSSCSDECTTKRSQRRDTSKQGGGRAAGGGGDEDDEEEAATTEEGAAGAAAATAAGCTPYALALAAAASELLPTPFPVNGFAGKARRGVIAVQALTTRVREHSDLCEISAVQVTTARSRFGLRPPSQNETTPPRSLRGCTAVAAVRIVFCYLLLSPLTCDAAVCTPLTVLTAPDLRRPCIHSARCVSESDPLCVACGGIERFSRAQHLTLVSVRISLLPGAPGLQQLR